MDFMTALDISASGMTVERTQLNVTAMNLANAHTTRVAGGLGPYQRKSVVSTTSNLDNPFGTHMKTALDREVYGTKVVGIATDARNDRIVYEPSHPDADEQGYVRYPDINIVEEMTLMMTAQRNFDANASAIDTIKAMYTKALDIGRS